MWINEIKRMIVLNKSTIPKAHSIQSENIYWFESNTQSWELNKLFSLRHFKLYFNLIERIHIIWCVVYEFVSEFILKLVHSILNCGVHSIEVHTAQHSTKYFVAYIIYHTKSYHEKPPYVACGISFQLRCNVIAKIVV